MAQDWRLVWGTELLAAPGTRTPTTAGYVIECLSEGMSFGSPQAVVETISSLISDGTLAVTQRWDNREVTLRVRLRAPSVDAGPALAAAESALMAQVRGPGRPPPLVWTSPATGAEASVLDAVVATLERDYAEEWDLQEATQEYRYYLLTLQCFPFVRGEDRVTVPALAPNPPSPTTNLIDDCTSLTNWSVESAGFGNVQRTNLVKNPSFETNTSGWKKNAAVSGFYRDDDVTPQVGSKYAVIERAQFNEGPSTVSIFTDKFAVTGSADYTASAYVRYDGTYPFDTRVRLRWLNSSGGVISNSTSVDVDPGTSWTRVSVTDAAPSNAVQAEFFVTFDTPGPNVAHYYVFVDAVLIEQSGTLNDYFDGDTPDSGSTAYYWTGTPYNSTSIVVTEPAAAVVSGAIEVSGATTSYGEGSRRLAIARSAAVDMTGLPYLRVAEKASFSGGWGVTRRHIDDVQVTPIAAEPSAIAGHVDYYYETGDFTEFETEVSNILSGNSATVSVAHMEATDTLPGIVKQKSRLTQVGGSARTQAALRLYDGTDPLGTDTLIYTTQSEFSPMLRRDWTASSAAPSASSDAVSGSYVFIDSTPLVFRFPVADIDSGLHSLMARLGGDASNPTTLEWEIKLTDNAGADVIGSDVVVTGSADYAAGEIGGTDPSNFVVVAFDAVDLPTVAAEGDQHVQITLSSTGSIAVDEVWPFNLDEGALTWIHDPNETLQWVEIRSPELDAPQPAVYGSASGDGSNAADVSYLCLPPGIHQFEPGQMQVFTVTTTSEASSSELEYYDRNPFHHAA